MAYASRVGTIESMWPIKTLIAICLTLGISAAEESVAAGVVPAVSLVPTLPVAQTVRPAPGTFLVATRALDGSHFGETVVYLVEHDDSGSMGLIVNRPGHVGLEEVAGA